MHLIYNYIRNILTTNSNRVSQFRLVREVVFVTVIPMIPVMCPSRSVPLPPSAPRSLMSWTTIRLPPLLAGPGPTAPGRARSPAETEGATGGTCSVTLSRSNCPHLILFGRCDPGDRGGVGRHEARPGLNDPMNAPNRTDSSPVFGKRGAKSGSFFTTPGRVQKYQHCVRYLMV